MSALDEWNREVERAMKQIVRPGWSLPADMAQALAAAGFRALAGKDAEIARLQAELDATSDVPVEYVVEAGLAAAMAADPHREDGALLRTTDGSRRAFAWRKAAGEWEPR